MKKIRSKLPVVLLILAAPMLNSCGGGDGSVAAIIEDFIPVFVNQWQGVDSDFMLHEFQFDVVTPGSSSGEFNQADSSVQVSDKFGNSQPSLEFRGTYDQQNFDFETIDSNGNVVGSFSARISNDNQFIDITPINPAAPRFRIYLLEDGVSPIPDLEGAWGDAVSSMVFELNPGTSDQDFSAFFTGSDQSQTDKIGRAHV